MRTLSPLLAVLALATSACGDGGDAVGDAGGDTSGGDYATGCDPAAPATRTASCIHSFVPGEGAGVGQAALPGCVFGEPHGAGTAQGNADETDVLSLGHMGEIVVGFGGNAIVDGDGPDFVVFENAFYAFNRPDKPFVDPAEVSVSEDGVTWFSFPCDRSTPPYLGCAGREPVLANPDTGVSSFDPAVSGGDVFDLATIGVTRARLVRIVDRGVIIQAPNAGFDLDAVVVLQAERP